MGVVADHVGRVAQVFATGAASDVRGPPTCGEAAATAVALSRVAVGALGLRRAHGLERSGGSRCAWQRRWPMYSRAHNNMQPCRGVNAWIKT